MDQSWHVLNKRPSREGMDEPCLSPLFSSAMTISISIPQGIVEEIASHLHSSIAILKTCSIVSQAFHFPSRKHLLCTVTADPSTKALSLYAMISHNSTISTLICVLYVPQLDSLLHISTIVPMLTHTQHPIMGVFNNLGYWPLECSVSASALLQRRNCEVQELRSILSFPQSLLKLLPHIRSLTVWLWTSITADTTPISLMDLKLIHVLGLEPGPIRNTPNVHQIVIGGLRTPQNVSNAAAQTAKAVICYAYTGRHSNHISSPSLNA
jgi:hypothetical protein